MNSDEKTTPAGDFQGCFTKSNSVFRVYSDDKEIARSVFLLRKH